MEKEPFNLLESLPVDKFHTYNYLIVSIGQESGPTNMSAWK